MSLGPMNIFDTAPVYHLQFKQGVVPYPITSFIYIKLHLSQRNTRTHKFGTGIFTVTNAALGMVDYNWNPQDTSTPGIWDVWAEIMLSNGTVLSSLNTETLQITNRIRGYSKHVAGRMNVSLT